MLRWRQKSLRGSFLILSVFAWSAIALVSAPPASHPAISPVEACRTAQRADDAIWAQLAQPLARVEFVDVPFDIALQSVLKQANVRNWHVCWGSLTDANVERDRAVSLQLFDLPASRALDLLLWQVVPVEDAGSLGYEAIDGVLMIAQADELERPYVTRVYPISDLLANDTEAGTWPDVDNHRAHIDRAALRRAIDALQSAADQLRELERSAASRPATSRAVACFPNLSEWVEEPWLGRKARQISEMIRTVVEPDSWNVAGGVGTLWIQDNVLVVLNSRSAHRRLQQFLAELRAARETQAPP